MFRLFGQSWREPLAAVADVQERSSRRVDAVVEALERLEAELRQLREDKQLMTGGTPADGRDWESIYVGFENQFRGNAVDVRQQLLPYVDIFKGASKVLDLGCGRGEFLDLLREHGIQGIGIDDNRQMVEICRSKGLEAVESDALEFLKLQSNVSLGGVMCSHMLEHTRPAYVLQMLRTVLAKLKPGSALVIETVNVQSWCAFFSGFLRDPTHTLPLHPDTLKYLVAAAGFESASVQYRVPVPRDQELQYVPDLGPDIAPDSHEWARVLNHNVRALNDRLFAEQNYAIVARRP
jgi:O-antigen chain-terminating methyltransferase